MNRKIVLGTLLGVSLLFNVVMFVFSLVQKSAADDLRQTLFINDMRHQQELQLAESELDQCEGLRSHSDLAREDCERRILAIANKK